MRKLLLFTLAAAAVAQAPLQVTTRLVQMAVVVRDKHGAVAHLTKSDFEILDKGKSRPRVASSQYVFKSPGPPVRVPGSRHRSVV